MTTFAIPTVLAPQSLEWGLRSNSWSYGPSQLSGDVQTMETPGARWVATFGYTDLSPEVAPTFESFLVKMRGLGNRFTSHNFFRPAPRGTIRGSLTVVGAHSRFAVSVTVTGGAGQANKTALAGDFFSINGQLVMLRADATANGSGVIVLPVEPPMRAALAGGESVVWDKPTVTFMLDEKESRWGYETTALRNLTFSGMEVW